MIEFWLFVSLLVLVVLLWRPIRDRVLPALDARAERIRADLEEAQRLHEEAKALLARYQRQLHEGERLAAEILRRAEAEQQRLEEAARAEFEELVVRRTRQAEERIRQEEARAIARVRVAAAELAMAATRQILAERIGPQEGRTILDRALEEVRQKLH
ncbi:ATP synthase subunit b [bacterium HR40]|nr:ATP synthase subunit b [bacterium HR40]